MLKIRLNKSGSAASGGGDAIPLPEENVTVTCPPHLVLADLPVARSIGKLGKAPIKIVGRKAQGGLGERVRFCVACDLPIAVYGRLIPCAHAFCLDCAKKDANCHLCDHRIEKIQTIKMKEKIFICGGPRCFKSFVEKSEFESHLHEFHSHLLPPNKEKKVGDGPDAVNVAKPSPPNPDAKQSTPADSSTFQVPSKTVIPPNSPTHPNGLEGKSHQNIPRVEPPAGPPKPPTFYPQHQNYPPELQQENKQPPVFDGSGHYQSFHNQKSDRFPDKQLAISTESPLPDYPMRSRPLPNFMVPVNPGAGLAPTFNHPPLPVEGLQSFYKAPYEIVQGMTPGGSEQSSVFSFPPVPSGGLGFVEGYPQPLNMGLAAMSLDQSNSQGRTPFVQADYTSFPGWVPLERPLMPSVAVKPLEPPQGGNIRYNMDGKAVLTPEPMPPISPPLPPPHLMQLPQQGNYPHLGDTGREGQSYMWQNENRTGFRGDRN